MQLYFKSLRYFAECYYFVEQRINDVLLSFAVKRTGLRKAAERAMLANLEQLTRNVNKCKEWRELETCKALYDITLVIPFPEYHSYYGMICNEMFKRKEQQILKQS